MMMMMMMMSSVNEQRGWTHAWGLIGWIRERDVEKLKSARGVAETDAGRPASVNPPPLTPPKRDRDNMIMTRGAARKSRAGAIESKGQSATATSSPSGSDTKLPRAIATQTHPAVEEPAGSLRLGLEVCCHGLARRTCSILRALIRARQIPSRALTTSMPCEEGGGECADGSRWIDPPKKQRGPAERRSVEGAITSQPPSRERHELARLGLREPGSE